MGILLPIGLCFLSYISSHYIPPLVIPYYVLNYISVLLYHTGKAVLKVSIMNEQFMNIDRYSWNSYEACKGD